MHHKVLACVDHSSYSSGVCDYAAWAAMRLNAPLEFIHVLARHPETAQKRDLSGSIGLGAQEALLADLAAFDEKRSKIAMKSGRPARDRGPCHPASHRRRSVSGMANWSKPWPVWKRMHVCLFSASVAKPPSMRRSTWAVI